MSWESEVIALCVKALTASLARPFALAAAAWLVLRVLRVRHPASRHSVWTAVLIGMLLLPVVSVVTPHWKLLALPPAEGPAFTPSEPFDSVTPQTAPELLPAVSRPAAGSTFAPVLWCYAVGVLAIAAYRVAGWVLLWRVVSRSTPLRTPCLRESADVLTPVAAGLLRPAVILPAGWRRWNANTRRAVFAHEFAHLRRHDALVSAVGRFATCVFWFHPLAWWVSRKISELAELACDAAALEKVGDPAGYSRTLLEFADAVSRAGRRVALPGLAMAAGSNMDRRIDHVFELSRGLSGDTLRKLAHPGLWLPLLGVPLVCLAATAGLGEPAPPAAVTPLVQALPQASPQSPTQTVAAAKPEPYLSAIGNVSANTVTVKPRVDGQLMSVTFNEGEMVQAGQLLGSIDSRPYRFQLTQAEGKLARDLAELDNAQADLRRSQQLVDQNAIPKEQLDAPRAAVAQLEGSFRSDQASVENAKLQLTYTNVIAPITGVAGLRLIDPGNMVHAADATGIVIITQLQPIAVVFAIAEARLAEVLALLRDGAKPPVEIWNRDNSVKITTGRMTAVDNQIDQNTGTVKLKAVFDNRDGALFPNQFVNVRLLVNTR